MKNELSRNFQQTIVLGLPNCQIDNRTVRLLSIRYSSKTSEKHLFRRYGVKLKSPHIESSADLLVLLDGTTGT